MRLQHATLVYWPCFLTDASSHLYKWLCPSVRRAEGPFQYMREIVEILCFSHIGGCKFLMKGGRGSVSPSVCPSALVPKFHTLVEGATIVPLRYLFFFSFFLDAASHLVCYAFTASGPQAVASSSGYPVLFNAFFISLFISFYAFFIY